jgi:hypothetical protein
MSSPKLLLLGATLATFALGGCPRGICAQQDAPGSLTWTAIPPDAVETTAQAHAIHFAIARPAAGPARRIELCFARPLDGAEVELFGTGPRHLMTKVDERRVSGDHLSVELPPLSFDRFDVIVHHQLRPAPLPPRVRIAEEVRP